MRNDPTRLAELRRHLILDSSPVRAFDVMTQLLAKSLDVPMVMVNLLDDGRDWFKSCVGLPQHESPAATSFCEAFFRSADNRGKVRRAQEKVHRIVLPFKPPEGIEYQATTRMNAIFSSV